MPPHQRTISAFSVPLAAAAFVCQPTTLSAPSCRGAGAACAEARASEAVFAGKVVGIADSPRQVQFGDRIGTVPRNRIGSPGKSVDTTL